MKPKLLWTSIRIRPDALALLRKLAQQEERSTANTLNHILNEVVPTRIKRDAPSAL